MVSAEYFEHAPSPFSTLQRFQSLATMSWGMLRLASPGLQSEFFYKGESLIGGDQDTAFAEGMAGDQQVHQPKRPPLPGLHCPKATKNNGAGLGPGQNLKASQR